MQRKSYRGPDQQTYPNKYREEEAMHGGKASHPRSESYTNNSKYGSAKWEDDSRSLRRQVEAKYERVKSEQNDHFPGFMKEEPNFEVSGLLAEEQNQRNGVALLFTVSPDKMMPDKDDSDWRLFEFRGDSNTRSIRLLGHSCFLLGTDKRLENRGSEEDISFIFIDDSTCSKQHAVIQFRRIRDVPVPYIMDLGSTNKTYLNKKSIEPSRYVELRHQDVLTFSQSDTEFVLLNAKS
jgi:smad nuclear-interacting protein 1